MISTPTGNMMGLCKLLKFHRLGNHSVRLGYMDSNDTNTKKYCITYKLLQVLPWIGYWGFLIHCLVHQSSGVTRDTAHSIAAHLGGGVVEFSSLIRLPQLPRSCSEYLPGPLRDINPGVLMSLPFLISSTGA